LVLARAYRLLPSGSSPWRAVRHWAILPIACPSSRNLAAATPTTTDLSQALTTGMPVEVDDRLIE
jgi:hypothetical protein